MLIIRNSRIHGFDIGVHLGRGVGADIDGLTVTETPVAIQLDGPSPGRSFRRVIHVPRPAHTRKIPRNDPCPCGSGKKHKRCCGR